MEFMNIGINEINAINEINCGTGFCKFQYEVISTELANDWCGLVDQVREGDFPHNWRMTGVVCAIGKWLAQVNYWGKTVQTSVLLG